MMNTTEYQVKHNDCLAELREIAENSVDLIYLDPPFFTQRQISGPPQGKEASAYQFNDIWTGRHEYLYFLQVRLVELQRILKPTGSLFFHCDQRAGHWVRMLLDDIFSVDQFRSEIIWHYKRWSNVKKGLQSTHQKIFFYTKTDDFTFNHLYGEYSPTTNVEQLLQKRTRDEEGKSVYAKDEKGEHVLNEAKQGVPLGDVWDDIPYLNPNAKERTGYPTQKPLLLLERIIQLASHAGDIVLDPFCGSGTSLVAAKLLGRNAVGIDSSEEAVTLTQERLETMIRTDSKIVQFGREFVYKTEGYILEAVKALGATLVSRDSRIDGLLAQRFRGMPVPLRVQRLGESLQRAVGRLVQYRVMNQQVERMVLVRTDMKDRIELPEKVVLVDHPKFFLKNKLYSYF
ncbi:DNA-methyltransferase [Piscirickettsia salmonis]|uniref:DNA-methyltransferase n=1 Tax=Piscirickettsia salmonis TaxID=1238 RepID=UPI0007C91BDB|nr:DNA adenine methyltransferase YhdJ [Piscirickettsiaceae bacterium NZ-RLO1]